MWEWAAAPPTPKREALTSRQAREPRAAALLTGDAFAVAASLPCNRKALKGAQLNRWVQEAVARAESLPPK